MLPVKAFLAAASPLPSWVMSLDADSSNPCKDLPGNLSGGMRQRGALLRTLMEGRMIVLMDEPFSALDAQLRGQMRALTAQLQQELNIPLLLVSHDAEDTRRLADEVWQLADGGLRRV